MRGYVRGTNSSAPLITRRRRVAAATAISPATMSAQVDGSNAVAPGPTKAAAEPTAKKLPAPPAPAVYVARNGWLPAVRENGDGVGTTLGLGKLLNVSVPWFDAARLNAESVVYDANCALLAAGTPSTATAVDPRATDMALMKSLRAYRDVAKRESRVRRAPHTSAALSRAQGQFAPIPRTE